MNTPDIVTYGVLMERSDFGPDDPIWIIRGDERLTEEIALKRAKEYNDIQTNLREKFPEEDAPIKTYHAVKITTSVEVLDN